MNRRDFLRNASAASLAPLVPVGAIAAPAVPTFTPYMVGVGAFKARLAGECSAKTLAASMNLSPDMANAMQRELVRMNVISAPNAAGVSVVVKPHIRAGAISRVTKVTKALPKLRIDTFDVPDLKSEVQVCDECLV